MATIKNSENIFLKMHPLHRILISLMLSAVVFFLVRESHLNPLLQAMLLWDVFAFSYIITCWIVFFKRSTLQIRNVAQQQDGSRVFVFLLIMVASFASMLTVLLLILSKEVSQTSGSYYLPIVIAGMLLSWFMVHTTFAFHYTHLYYDKHKTNPKKHAEGLCFPEEEEPDYLDFAYFAFVIGMTFQVSDVAISSRTIRRLALAHGLLSFGLNTFVVALTINIIAGLKN